MALNTISADLRAQISNYLDDINCGARNFEELRRIVIAILDMCVTYQITLKPSKTRIGFETSEYAGFEVGKGVRRLAEKHMEAIRSMKVPKNVSELRCCLGVFVQLAHFIKDYKALSKPLTRLTGSIRGYGLLSKMMPFWF